jgi:hypothetical protein
MGIGRAPGAADTNTGCAEPDEARPRHAGAMRAAVVRCRDLDILVFPAAIRVLILDAQVREVDLVIEVRQVMFACPILDFVWRAIRVTVVVVAVPIARVEPLLVLPLEFVVEPDAIDARAALLEAFGFAKIRAVHMDIVLDFPRPFKTGAERLSMTLVALTMALQKAAAFLREHDGGLAIPGHTHGLDQPLLAEMTEVAGPRIARPVPVIY